MGAGRLGRALAVIGAFGLHCIRMGVRERGKAPVKVLSVITVTGGFIAPLLVLVHYRLYPQNLAMGLMWAVLWGIAIVSIYAAIRKTQGRRVMLGCLGLVVVLKGAHTTSVIPEQNARKSPRRICEQINEHVPAGNILYMLAMSKPHFDFYLSPPVRTLRNTQALTKRGHATKKFYLLYREDIIPEAEQKELNQSFQIRKSLTLTHDRKQYRFLVMESKS
ncbi:MAG: hypothetical protein MAG794_01333 [Gammaproteobacteria bacterium]|nr:hypothetical protein [Gammaproteobacteria bacterium]